MRGAREIALLVLYRVEKDGSYADRVLDSLLAEAGLSQKDRALATELAFGTIRWRGKLDWILNHLVKGGLEGLTPWIRNILRLGAYQLLFCDRIPPFAAVSESVELAKIYGHSGVAKLVNGVLRKIGKETPPLPEVSAESLAISYSHPVWMVQRWIERWGTAETEQILRANNRVPPVSLRANTLRVSAEELEKLLIDEGLSPTPGRFAAESLNIGGSPLSSAAYRGGLFQIQDEGATLVGRLLAPEPGQIVVDLCSAPGGKATHLAELMGDSGLVVAVEINPGRLRLVLENCRRLGLGAVRGVVADGAEFSLRGWADKVLVDAPCSNLGVLRRRVDLRWRLRREEIEELAGLQSELLENGSNLVKKSGVLVYSTCTLEPEENEKTISAFLGSHPKFAMEHAARFLSEEVVDEEGYLRTFPHRHGLDGGFAARLRRLS